MWTFFLKSLLLLPYLCGLLACTWLLRRSEGTRLMPAEGPGKGISYIGYAPFKFTAPDGREGLIQIFVNPDGTIESVSLAYRQWSWDTWGVPTQAIRA